MPRHGYTWDSCCWPHKKRHFEGLSGSICVWYPTQDCQVSVVSAKGRSKACEAAPWHGNCGATILSKIAMLDELADQKSWYICGQEKPYTGTEWKWNQFLLASWMMLFRTRSHPSSNHRKPPQNKHWKPQTRPLSENPNPPKFGHIN